MIKEIRVDRWYDIIGQPPLRASRSRMTPDEAHVIHYGPTVVTGAGEPRVTVHVRGPITRKDGQRSERRALVVYGRFGAPLDQAPAWVRQIAASEGVQ